MYDERSNGLEYSARQYSVHTPFQLVASLLAHSHLKDHEPALEIPVHCIVAGIGACEVRLLSVEILRPENSVKGVHWHLRVNGVLLSFGKSGVNVRVRR